MTIIERGGGPEPPLTAANRSYDLIMCENDRIVYHEPFGSAALRLSTCVGVLTVSDLLSRAITADRAAMIDEVHRDNSSKWTTRPDDVLNAIAKLCRPWGVQVYASAPLRGPAERLVAGPPAELYSVVTDYGHGDVMVEHFPDRASRTASLRQRLDQFVGKQDSVPEALRDDDQRLASLVSAFLMTAAVSLAETVFDPAQGFYKPSGSLMRVH